MQKEVDGRPFWLKAFSAPFGDDRAMLFFQHNLQAGITNIQTLENLNIIIRTTMFLYT